MYSGGNRINEMRILKIAALLLAVLAGSAVACAAEEGMRDRSWAKRFAEKQNNTRLSSPESKVEPRTKSPITPVPTGQIGSPISSFKSDGKPALFGGAVASAESPPLDAFYAIRQARRASEANDLHTAKQLLEPIVRQFPTWESPVSDLADVLLREGNVNDAYRILSPVVDPAATDLTLSLASLAMSLRGEIYAGQLSFCFGQADQFFTVSGSRSALPTSNRPSALTILSAFAVAAQHIGTGYDVRAIPYLELIIRRDPKNALALQQLGRIAVQKGDPKRAIMYLQGAIKYGKFGILRSSQLDLAQAEAMLKRSKKVGDN